MVLQPEQTRLLGTRRQTWGIVFGLARADLMHEWILTLCLTMAVLAVLTPLLLLFGLKYGTIETLRWRLVQDPRNREIRPLTSRSFSHEWFLRMQRRPDIGFLIPMTRGIASEVTAMVQGQTTKLDVDLLPTAVHDPLLVENGAKIPGPGECVLSHFAAADLQASIGTTLLISAKRRLGGRYEAATMTLQVVDVLSLRATSLKGLYVQLDVLEAVERYKDGQAVPEFGWSGAEHRAYPQYDALVLILPTPLTSDEERSLPHNTGFTTLTAMTPAELQARTRLQVRSEVAIYFLATQKKPVEAESIEIVRQKVRGKAAILLPWIAPLPAQLLNADGEAIATLGLAALSIETSQATALQLTPVPPWSEQGMDFTILLPADITVPDGPMSLHIEHESTTLTFPITLSSERSPIANTAFLPLQLGGVLNLVRSRPLAYDANGKTFVVSRRGYASFRLYAKTIDDVEGLRRYFVGEQIPVYTEAQRIKDVTDLDTYLTLIFWCIAAIGIFGGSAALLASLYAAVERKRRELGVLRLLGFSRLTLWRYPLYQGILISLGGYAAALLCFASMAAFINRLFGAHLGHRESFCKLPVPHAIGALLMTLLLTALAATWAAWRVTKIDPAEALRDE